MNVKCTAAFIACLATPAIPTPASAQMLMPVAVQLAQAETDDAYNRFVNEVTAVSGLTELQKKRMMGIVAQATQDHDDSSKEQQAAFEHECERQIWGILTQKQQDELKSQDPKLFPPS